MWLRPPWRRCQRCWLLGAICYMPSHFHGYYGPALAKIQLVNPDSALMHMLLSVDALTSNLQWILMAPRCFSWLKLFTFFINRIIYKMCLCVWKTSLVNNAPFLCGLTHTLIKIYTLTPTHSLSAVSLYPQAWDCQELHRQKHIHLGEHKHTPSQRWAFNIVILSWGTDEYYCCGLLGWCSSLGSWGASRCTLLFLTSFSAFVNPCEVLASYLL